MREMLWVKQQQHYPGQSTLVARTDQATEHHMQEASTWGLKGNKAQTGTQTLLCCSSVSCFERNGREMPAGMNKCFPNTPDATSKAIWPNPPPDSCGLCLRPSLWSIPRGVGCTSLSPGSREELSAPQPVLTHRRTSSSRSRFGTKGLSSFISITRNVPASLYCCGDKHCSLCRAVCSQGWHSEILSTQATHLQTAEIQLVL